MNPLARMALHRTPTRGRDMPHVPDNRDRLRTFRAIAPVQLGNAYPWRFHGSQSGANPGPSNPAGCQLSQYEITETLDGRYPSDDMHFRG